MAYLKHSLNGETAAVYEIDHKTLIGRHGDCQIVIDDPTISARHAVIERRETADYWVTDLGSTNGVRVGKERVREKCLADGDVICLGVHQFQFCREQPRELDQTLKIKKSWIPGVYYTEK